MCYLLLDDKLKIENAETLTYIRRSGEKRIMIFSALYICIVKQLL